jgi:putative membrane protein
MKDRVMVAAAACLIAAAAMVSAQGGAGQPAGGQRPADKPPATQKPSTDKPGGQASDAAAKKAGSTDAAFLRQMGNGNMAEVAHGKLATQNASAAEVKQFGQRMADDHGKALEELKGLAAQKNVTLPAELDAKHKAMQDKLSKMKGEEFDRAYMSHMVSAHAQTTAAVQQEIKGGKDPDVQAWAQKVLPTVQEHHKLAQSIHAKLKGSGAAK